MVSPALHRTAGGPFCGGDSIDRRIVLGYLIGLLLAVALFRALVSLVLSRPWVLIALGATPFLTYLLPRQLGSTSTGRANPLCAASSAWRYSSCPVCRDRYSTRSLCRRSLIAKAVVATKAATQSFSHIAKIGYFGWVATSAAEAVTPLLLAALVVAAVVGTSASRKVLKAMTDANFRNWTRRVVLAVGAVYLISGLWALLGGGARMDEEFRFCVRRDDPAITTLLRGSLTRPVNGR